MARRLSDYAIDHHDVLGALKLESEELEALTDRRFAIGRDAAWAAGGLGAALVIGVPITAGGAWLGVLIAAALGVGGLYADDKDQNALAIVLFLGVLAGLGRAVQCAILEGVESFAIVLAAALLSGILVMSVLGVVGPSSVGGAARRPCAPCSATWRASTARSSSRCSRQSSPMASRLPRAASCWGAPIASPSRRSSARRRWRASSRALRRHGWSSTPMRARGRDRLARLHEDVPSLRA